MRNKYLRSIWIWAFYVGHTQTDTNIGRLKRTDTTAHSVSITSFCMNANNKSRRSD